MYRGENMKKIVALGRGGVGKTCFIAAAARCLMGRAAVLLIDADPDQNLAEMMGLDLEKEGVRTISELFFDIKSGRVDEKIESAPLAEKADYLLNRHGLYEGEAFDLLALGTKWTEGCYCQPNNILKAIITRLESGYAHVLIDSPAGLEHLNRRVTSAVDDVFAVIGGSKKALDNARRAKRVIEEIRIRYGCFYSVAGYDFPPDRLDALEGDDAFRYAGKLDRDAEVARITLEGGSFMEMAADSPFLSSVRGVLRAAAYPV
jgi:CO dehydrogenase maturation factor